MVKTLITVSEICPPGKLGTAPRLISPATQREREEEARKAETEARNAPPAQERTAYAVNKEISRG